MITRVVKMTFKPGETKLFKSIFEQSQELIQASDGCISVKLMQDMNNPHQYFTLSEWESDQHLADYRASELFRTTWAQVKPLFAEKAEAWSLNAEHTS